MSGNELDTTVDEWREALGGLNENVPGMTSEELSDKFGISQRAIQVRIKKLLEAGGCKVSGTRRRMDTVGRMIWIPVYKITEEKER